MARSTNVTHSWCAHCAMNDHLHCTGTAVSLGKSLACECAGRDHNPTVDVAAEMALYVNYNLADKSVEARASAWRRFAK